MKKHLVAAALFTLSAVPMAAHALIYQFTASLSQANEVGTPAAPSSATGLATLFYDTADDTFDFSMAVFGLTGGTAAGTAANGHHIHGLATVTQNAPVRVGLDGAGYTRLNSGSTLLVGGVDRPGAMMIPAGNGHDAMSFLDALRAGLMYVNVHTALNAPGEARGQLMEVAVIPEPGTYALMIGGLAALGGVIRRRQRG